MRSDVDDLKAFDGIKITVNGRCGAGDYVDDCEFAYQANNGEWQYSEVPTVGEAYYGLIQLDWPDDEEAEALGPRTLERHLRVVWREMESIARIPSTPC